MRHRRAVIDQREVARELCPAVAQEDDLRARPGRGTRGGGEQQDVAKENKVCCDKCGQDPKKNEVDEAPHRRNLVFYHQALQSFLASALIQMSTPSGAL